MPESRFSDAKAVYDLLTKYPRITRLASHPNEVLQKLEQLRKGLPAENEFVSLVSWLGKCELAHALDQKQVPAWARDRYQVPDLFAVFKVGEALVPVLVEVKTDRGGKLVFGEKYYRKLVSYARITKLPLLVAWKMKSFGLWALTDINVFKRKAGAYHLTFEGAIKQSLMGVLAGDFGIRLYPGISVGWTISKEKLVKTEGTDPRGSVQEWEGKIKDFWVKNKDGQPVTKISGILFFVLNLMEMEENSVVEEDSVTVTSTSPEGGLVFAHRLHVPALVGLGEKFEPDEINWDDIIMNERYEFSSKQLLDFATAAMYRDHIVNFLVNVQPNNWPAWLPRPKEGKGQEPT